MNWDSWEDPKNSRMTAETGRTLISPRGRDLVGILRRHALLDEALEAGDTDAQLVLQQLAHAAHAAVAEVVDVVHRADAVAQIEVGRHGGDDVVHRDVAVIELFDERADDLLFFRGDAHFGAGKDLVEEFAGRDELDAVLAALFAVLALLCLFVVRGLGLRGEVDLVDAVEVMLGDRFDVRVVAGGGDLLGETKFG